MSLNNEEVCDEDNRKERCSYQEGPPRNCNKNISGAVKRLLSRVGMLADNDEISEIEISFRIDNDGKHFTEVHRIGLY